MSIHDIALSLQRKIRSDFPLSMLGEKSLNMEKFLVSCFSGRSKDILETSKSLKKDLEIFLESTEKSLSQHITQDFDKLLSIPSLMLNLETDISDIYSESLKYYNAIHKLNSESPSTIEEIHKSLDDMALQNQKRIENENSSKLRLYFNEIQKKILIYKECSSLPFDQKSSIMYGPIAERISKLFLYCDNLDQNHSLSELIKFKSEFLLIMQREAVLWSCEPSIPEHFKCILESYKNLMLEVEIQMILRDNVVYPVLNSLMPSQNSLTDEQIDLNEYFSKILNEVYNGKLSLFVKFSNDCDILIKCVWKASIKVLQTKTKIFSPIFSQDYQLSLLKSIQFSEEIGSNLTDPKSFRSSSDFQEFLEKWNLPTFFELKKNEIIKPLLILLKSEDLESFISFSPSGVYLTALSQCIESILIPELYQKFLRLFLQTLSTYCNFVTRKLNSQMKSKGINADDLSNLIKDINSLKKSIIDVLLVLKDSKKLLDFDQIMDQVRQEAESSLHQLLDPCLRALGESITKLCIANLQSIKTIPTIYRTGKTMPTGPSAFVASFLQPLKVVSVDILPKEKIINKILLDYIKIVQETKQEILKAGELLTKFNPDSLETVKMNKQLELDKEKFITDLASLGFTSENNEIINQICLE